MQAIVYNNYKQSITFQNCESLCYTPETYNIEINYTSIKKKYVSIVFIPFWTKIPILDVKLVELINMSVLPNVI